MTLFGPTADAIGIRDLYRRVSLAITRAMRGEVWVRAEISSLQERNGWCRLTLAEPARDDTERDAFLDVVVFTSPWARIRRQLDERGLALQEGMTVAMRGEVCLRPDARGRIQLRCSALDTDALLGELTARRRALRSRLVAEGLINANARRSLGPVPLRVGLVASHHSQGYEDFRAVLAASGYAFALVEKPVLVQGRGAPAEVATAIAAFSGADIDVIVLVRGGGARADLDAFDSELVARAVASAEVPVWTGVGHTGDRYLADEVAAAAHATPTACAHALVSVVAGFDRAVGERARRIQELADSAAATAQDELVRRRRHLAGSAGARLDRRADSLVHQGQVVQRAAARVLAGAGAGLTAFATRLPRVTETRLEDATRRHRRQAGTARDAVAGGLARSERELAAVRRVLTAYDPARQLERGWTLTFGEDGALVRRAAALRAGERITSRFVDGDRTSVVEAPTAAAW